MIFSLQSHRDHGVVTTLNSVVLEMCDGLWRDRAFLKDSSSAQKHRSRHKKLSDLAARDLFTDSARLAVLPVMLQTSHRRSKGYPDKAAKLLGPRCLGSLPQY